MTITIPEPRLYPANNIPPSVMYKLISDPKYDLNLQGEVDLLYYFLDHHLNGYELIETTHHNHSNCNCN